MARGKYEYWITPEGLLKIEGWARDGLIDEQIAQKIGVSRSTLNKWKQDYSDISDALKKGKEIVDRQVENALLKRALGYTYTEVTRERIEDKGQNKRHNGVQELTEQDWAFAKAYFGHACCYCGRHIDLTKDHLRPLNQGGTLSRDNVVPCCKSCNSSKKDHEWKGWYQKQPFYNKARADKVCEYMTFIAELRSIEPEEDDKRLVVTKVVTKEVIPDTTAQIFWLKNRKPKDWRDKINYKEFNSAESEADGFLEALKEEAASVWQE